MTRLSWTFLAVLAVLLAGFVLVVADGTTAGVGDGPADLVRVTGLPGPVLAVQLYEHRWRAYADGADVFHPGLVPIDYLGLAYAW